MVLNVTATGLESIDEDLKTFQKGLGKAVSAAMTMVGADMQSTLRKHIQTDVYGVYKPKEYLRRSENEGLGTPLNDMENTTTVINRGAGVTLDYRPLGEHETEEWANHDLDDLIGVIETGEGYKFKSPGPRPFWQNMVQELVDDGGLFDVFAAAMAMQGIVVEAGEGPMVVREEADGNY